MTLLQKPAAVLGRLVHFGRQRGVRSVVRSALRWGGQWLLGRLGVTSYARGSFEYDGRWVPYFHHPYNYTWLNERAVETALALEVLEEHRGKDVLEVGNVLGHYVPVGHVVVDKYERAPGVLNVDVADLALDARFDLILAVSTLEHVGLDEEVRDPLKAGRAISGLKGLLKPGGRLWVTHPVGYNADLDRQLRAGELGFTRLRALRRDDTRNSWREVSVDDVWDAAYDRLVYTAHGVVVAEYVAAP
ncbi:hypothetical protein NSZ01_06230 [Nocardioides szechwanensis]|uniref:Methyltransferase domain-containing protein n=1 Tax=Nocardioides szechwanensis TaxID=1005944 RepID=A0A1G9VRK6_9ACTN|nr:class I SAM-dependent methyltransferase [Nocardioides szechwanensis]GEP32855.1 hypothetical protein NSZ01_06230 [Nocardioides szechwanensis]SDM74726.1 hypothetical protein SAMN05192576_0839 [Nocardioides szechwanensis]